MMCGGGNVFLAVDVGETNPMLNERRKTAFEVFYDGSSFSYSLLYCLKLRLIYELLILSFKCAKPVLKKCVNRYS